MKYILSVFLTSIVYLACSDESEPSFCFSFDERQCATDVWKDSADFSLTDQQKISVLSDALSDLNLDVKEISVDPNFHDAVCEACHVCPTGTRFYVRLGKEPGSSLSSLDLLNYEIQPCDQVF